MGGIEGALAAVLLIRPGTGAPGARAVCGVQLGILVLQLKLDLRHAQLERLRQSSI
jgi:hypothetical protein